MAIPRAERLLNLLALLLHSSQPVSAEFIQSTIGGYPESPSAFHRAFERDKEALRDVGVPLEVREVPGERLGAQGYFVDEAEYYLPSIEFTESERAALHAALSAVRIFGADTTDQLRRLGTAAPTNAEMGAVISRPPALPGVLEAAGKRAVLTFAYRGEERTVDPVRVEFSDGRWYLRGWDVVKDAARSYRIDRIEGAVGFGSEGSAEIHEIAETQRHPWLYGDEPPIDAKIAVAADYAAVVDAGLGSDAKLGHDEAGRVLYSVPITSWVAFRSFVVSFLDHVEVLEPEHLRADLAAWVSAVANERLLVVSSVTTAGGGGDGS